MSNNVVNEKLRELFKDYESGNMNDAVCEYSVYNAKSTTSSKEGTFYSATLKDNIHELKISFLVSSLEEPCTKITTLTDLSLEVFDADKVMVSDEISSDIENCLEEDVYKSIMGFCQDIIDADSDEDESDEGNEDN